MVSYKDKIITFPLFNTNYPQNPGKNLATKKNTYIFDYVSV
jgi:hypothetical protein